MKSKVFLVAAVILLGSAALVQAQDEELGVTLDATWVGKYLWRGYDLLDDKAAFQPSIDIDLLSSGFSVNIWASYPVSAGDMNKTTTAPAGMSRVDATEFEYMIAYDTILDEGEAWATAVRVQGIHYDFIDRPDQAADAYEAGLRFAWPNLCPTGAVTPSYYVGRIWPAAGGAGAGKADLNNSFTGWIHIFGVGYDLEIPGLTADSPQQVLTLSASAVYNDGYADTTGTVDHDWSHALFSVTTQVELAKNVSFNPGLYYQWSWDDSVNPEDEIWLSIGASCRF